MQAIILGTGPSLSDQADEIRRLKNKGFKLFGVNNTYMDFDLDVWIACDPKWHDIYSPAKGNFDKWHWDKQICEKYGYKYIEGRWGNGPNRCDGLSKDKNWIAYGHSSGFQALGLAVHYGARSIYLAGYDMHYDGLIQCYETVAKQKGLPKIYNATRGSALKCFDFKCLNHL